MKAFANHSPLRIFAFSVLATMGTLVAVLFGMGPGAALVTVILIAVEVAFSFDNAIINARVLAKMPKIWQTLFLTFGMIIAIFGMRVVFPILIVAITAHLHWADVLNLALHHPGEYAEKLEHAHPSISSFGGAFLLMLALHFFFDEKREIRWMENLERQAQRLTKDWMPAVIVAVVVVGVAFLPFNHHRSETLTAGLAGVAVYVAMHAISMGMETMRGRETKNAARQVGFAALMSFIYLEILDASFSFDGVIGAFAVTDKVLLIAAGLGVGALWVRSLTVFMVRRGTLADYIYLEHGAHYTVFVLAFVLFVSLFISVPEVIVGMVGIGFIGASAIASQQALTKSKSKV
jgi:hypothetical protein